MPSSLTNEPPGTPETEDTKPRLVFISYSQETEEHNRQVFEFAAKLRNAGIESVLDRAIVNPAEGWAQWAEKQINISDYVCIVCTETYNLRVSGGGSHGAGLGAEYEGEIIRDHFFNKFKKEKFLAVYFGKE